MVNYSFCRSYLQVVNHSFCRSGFSVGSGVYSVRMRLHCDLPQFIPMCGKRIRLWYGGIPKMCSNCFGRHIRKECTNQKVQWIDYVQDFMNRHQDIPQDYYSKWAKIIDEAKKRDGLYTDLGSAAALYIQHQFY